jgi:50S ribosomal subunit-associated GTPase HflX
VVDRFALILEIFAANATTKEAKVQTDLATAMYERTRLVRGAARPTDKHAAPPN